MVQSQYFGADFSLVNSLVQNGDLPIFNHRMGVCQQLSSALRRGPSSRPTPRPASGSPRTARSLAPAAAPKATCWNTSSGGALNGKGTRKGVEGVVNFTEVNVYSTISGDSKIQRISICICICMYMYIVLVMALGIYWDLDQLII